MNTMTSRDRLLSTIGHEQVDHTPFLCWCFGVEVPPRLRWNRAGREVARWYTMRLEHLHTLPEPWGLEDDFERIKRWFSLGLDDVLEVSPPWGLHPDVCVRDWQQPPTADEPYALLGREYDTPAGTLRHIVRRTDEAMLPGWVVQPNHVPLFEDYNIPRAVMHAVAGSEDVLKVRYLLAEPRSEQLDAYRERMALVRRFAQEQGVLVQGWSAYGMDAIVWLCGVEGAILMAMNHPDLFQELVECVHVFDRRRTELMLDVGGVDLVVQRGWYSSTEFWSPRLFRRFVLPRLADLVSLTHQAGARFAYTMTTGVLPLAELLLEAGIDLLYHVDPVQDRVDLEEIKARFSGRLAVAGGVNSGVTLAAGSVAEIRQAVHHAVRTLSPGGGFILAPVDALFPDTPWAAVEAMISSWRDVRESVD